MICSTLASSRTQQQPWHHFGLFFFQLMFFMPDAVKFPIVIDLTFDLEPTLNLDLDLVWSQLTASFCPNTFPSSFYKICKITSVTFILMERQRRWPVLLLLGAVNVTVSAEAVASHVSCDNEVVSVPDRGRIDVVTKSLIVKVSVINTRREKHFYS